MKVSFDANDKILINLINSAGTKQLTVTKRFSQERSVPLAHQLARQVEKETNESSVHGKFGPWKIVTWNWA